MDALDNYTSVAVFGRARHRGRLYCGEYKVAGRYLDAPKRDHNTGLNRIAPIEAWRLPAFGDRHASIVIMMLVGTESHVFPSPSVDNV